MKKLFILLSTVAILATACDYIELENTNNINILLDSITYISPNPTNETIIINTSPEGASTTIQFEVLPKEAATILATNWEGSVRIQATYDENESDYIDMPITKVEANEDYGIISITASGENLSDKFYSGEQPASARIAVTCNDKILYSEYKQIVANKWFATKLPTPGEYEIFYIADNKITPQNLTTISNDYDRTKGCYKLTLRKGTSKISNLAFCNFQNLTNIAIGSGIIEIGIGAFSRNADLTNVILPEGITVIRNNAFTECPNLINITIPSSIVAIEANAFSGCSSLTSISTGDRLTILGDNAFELCTKLSNVILGSSIKTIGHNLFYGCASLKDITIPESVTNIGHYSFYGCSSLTSLKIPESVTEIGISAFQDCGSLTVIMIPESVTKIGESAFSGCEVDELIINSALIGINVIPETISEWQWRQGLKLKKLTVGGERKKWIGANAFSDCTDIRSVNIIGNSVIGIGANAFLNCNNLESITIPESVTTIGNKAFVNCSSLNNITIHYVTNLYSMSFKGCNSLEKIYSQFASTDNRCLIIDGVLTLFAPAGITSYSIPNNIRAIKPGAFYGFHELTSITIPDSVTEIYGWAFFDCRGLTSITIPDSITKICNYAFSDCNNLKDVYCKPTTPPSILIENNWRVFENNASDRKIYVPQESVEAYKNADGWSNYADAIVGYDF